MDRKKIGIVIDYTLRFPAFAECYNQMKKEIIDGEMKEKSEIQNLDLVYFRELSRNSREAYNFYLETITPQYDDNFDYTLKKYFFCKEDIKRFLQSWSFALFAQANSLKKINVDFVNVCQSKLCDVVLIDKISNSRQVPNTLAFLSKGRLFFKELKFVKSNLELKKYKRELFDLYNPTEVFIDKKVDYTLEENKFLDWLKELEVKLEKVNKRSNGKK